MPNYCRLAIATAAIVLSLAACSGDKADEGGNKEEAAAFPDAVVEDAIITRVNSQPIYGKDLRVYTLIYGGGTADSLDTKSYNLRTLDGLIDRLLLLQEAEAMGIAVDDSTHRWYVRQFVTAVGGDAAVDEILAKAGISRSEFESLIGKDLTIRRLLETSVLQPVVVPDSLARAYYYQNQQEFVTPDSVRARHIIIRASQNDTEADEAAKRKTLRTLADQARAGEDFGELAKQYSEGPSASDGGDLGYFAYRDMVPAFSEVAFSLEPGEVSDVVKTRFGLHIIQVVDRKESRTPEYEEIKDILIEQLKQYFVSQTLQNHLQRIRSVAIIENNF